MSEKHSGLDLAVWISQLLDKKGGRGIFVLDVREFSTITDYMIIVTGTSTRHIDTLVEAPVAELKKAGFPPSCIDGRETSWIVADFGDVILHVFDEGTRQHFNLEALWANAPRIDWEKEGKETTNPGLRVLSL